MNLLQVTALLLLTSCASIIEGSSQEVAVHLASNGSAECTATSAEESQNFTSPATITLKKSYYPAEISCTTDGKIGTVKTLSDVSNWGYGGAVLGIGIGAGVDTYTGAAFEYPAEIVVTLGETKVIGQTDFNSNVEFE